MPVEVFVKKMESLFVTLEQIERYLKLKGWTLDAGAFRSPQGGHVALSLEIGEQRLIDALAAFEHRPSYDVAQAVIASDRNK